MRPFLELKAQPGSSLAKFVFGLDAVEVEPNMTRSMANAIKHSGLFLTLFRNKLECFYSDKHFYTCLIFAGKPTIHF